MTQLSPNFTLEEMTFSEVALRKGIQNICPDAFVVNLQRLCSTLLEPARTILGVPLHVNSGYRSLAVNAAVGGATDSAHLEGRAADIVPIGMTVADAFAALRKTDLPADQIIYECLAWVHISVPRSGSLPRREALLASGAPGNWHYQLVTGVA